MNHGLFGKLSPGELTEFEDWRNIARLVYQNSKKHITMYRSVVSFDEETAAELMLKGQKDWQRYIENRILTISEKNGIKREHLQWACALHKEKNHPHVHVVFWDTSSQVKNPFTHPSVPNAIRKQMIKDTFAEKIRAFGEQKNIATADLRTISDELVDDFERHIRSLNGKKYQHIRNAYDEETELDGTFDFADTAVNAIADRVFKIKSMLPPKGRISYQLLPTEVKTEVDSLVAEIIKTSPAITKLRDDYVESKMQMTRLYGGTDKYLNSQKDRFTAEADKIIANRILGMVKTLNRLDYELKSADYLHDRRAHYTEQMLYEIMDMLNQLTGDSDQDIADWGKAHSGDLSKEARKELFLKFQDKGYEH